MGRAEAFSMLAALTFLAYYISCYDPNNFLASLLLLLWQSWCHHQSHQYDDYNNHLTKWCNQQWLQCLSGHSSSNKKYTPLQPSLQHVLGHQDKDPKWKLTIVKQLNIDCDHHAKCYVLLTHQSIATFGNPEIPEAQPHLSINGKIICRRFFLALCYAASTPN